MCVCAFRGVRASYNFGCRCPNTVETIRRWNRKPKAHGTQQSTGIRSPHVDEIAVEKALLGERVRLTIRERAIVVAKLTRLGLSTNVIGERLGLAARTVTRYRSGEQKHGRAA